MYIRLRVEQSNSNRGTPHEATHDIQRNPTSGPLRPGDRVEDIDDNSGNPTGYRGVVADVYEASNPG